jgi:hypothetical protein
MIYGSLLLLGALIWAAVSFSNSNYFSDVEISQDQPVPFSHEHHVGDDGIDCRYCHTSVAISSYAGMPSTQTCMTCHSELWRNSPMLEPVRSSYQTNQSIQWQRVYRLPEFVFFNHGIHISKGVGCSTCHGRVDQMPLLWPAVDLEMEWCLNCHRNPGQFIRPLSEVYKMDWTQPNRDHAQLAQQYNIAFNRITDCYTCHR